MISVIIPMYNSEKTIVPTVSSVIRQSRYDLIDEIIIVNDGSTDSSLKVIKCAFANSSKIKIISQKNCGVSVARNTGIRAAHSEWIALLDADDKWDVKKIEAQIEKINIYKDISFIGCNRNNENVKWGKKIEDDLYMLDLKHVLLKNWPSTPTVMIKRELLNTVGLFDECMRYGEDCDLWDRIACLVPIYYIPVSYVTAGNNKLPYGEKGLSANLSQMYHGIVYTLMKLKKNNSIGVGFYIFLRVYNAIKYVRRILISKLHLYILRIQR